MRRWAGIRTCGPICRTHGIIYQGFSLLTANRELFADPEVRAMAAKYGMGLAQLVFRFAMQIGMLPLTGTTDPQHMQEDLRSDQFTIAARRSPATGNHRDVTGCLSQRRWSGSRDRP
jgi:diketogulonate reductase-like aldo/keto reductase